MLAMERVSKDYDGFRIDGVSLELPPGSFTVLLGPSGSGKTTLLRLLAGLERPDQGRILRDGLDITSVPAERRGIALVFQDGALFPHLDVIQNVAFGLRAQRVPRAQAQLRAREALERVGLADKTARRIDRLSGGERQRVALARALAPRPRILLLDEPLANLDRNLREDLRAQLRRLHDELGLTSVLVTHDRDEALALADRLVVVRDGRIVEQGKPREMFREPKTAFAATLLGAANVLRIDGAQALVPPDAVFLAEGDGRREMGGVVRAVRFAGFHEEVELLTDEGHRLVARVAPGKAPPVGAEVGIAFDAARVRRLSPEP
jgi:ABC-type Fe3+/spermidine/putrescine transport system ATPase subunit